MLPLSLIGAVQRTLPVIAAVTKKDVASAQLRILDLGIKNDYYPYVINKGCWIWVH